VILWFPIFAAYNINLYRCYATGKDMFIFINAPMFLLHHGICIVVGKYRVKPFYLSSETVLPIE
jgi:hypothetical protein